MWELWDTRRSDEEIIVKIICRSKGWNKTLWALIQRTMRKDKGNIWRWEARHDCKMTNQSTTCDNHFAATIWEMPIPRMKIEVNHWKQEQEC